MKIKKKLETWNNAKLWSSVILCSIVSIINNILSQLAILKDLFNITTNHKHEKKTPSLYV